MTETAKGHAELVECPHCGSGKHVMVEEYQFPPDDEGEAWKWGYHVVCSAAGWDNAPRGCGSSSGWGETPAEATAAWNRRSTPIAAHGAGAVTEAHIDLVLDAAGDYMGVQYGNTALLHPTDRARIKATLSRPGEAAGWLTNCCQCKRIVDKRDAKDGGGPFGAELSVGRWTCSIECWTAVVDPAPDEAAGQGEADEPRAVQMLRGPLSKRATSAEFNEWMARDVVEYIDALSCLAGEGWRPKVKPLDWRDHRGHTFPDTWTAKTPCGVYEIEERSGSDSPFYVVTGPLHVFIATRPSPAS